MFLQTDKSFPPAINQWGCYFFSILAHAESCRNKGMTKMEILDIYHAAQMSGILQKEEYIGGILTDGCTVMDPVALFTLAGFPVRDIKVAEVNEFPKDGDLEVLIYHRPADSPTGMGNSEHTHFVCGDGHGGVRFDPIGTSNTVRYGYVQAKRLFLV